MGADGTAEHSHRAQVQVVGLGALRVAPCHNHLNNYLDNGWVAIESRQKKKKAVA